MNERLRAAIGKRVIISLYGSPIGGTLEEVSGDGVVSLRVKYREAMPAGEVIKHDDLWYIAVGSIHAFSVTSKVIDDDT